MGEVIFRVSKHLGVPPTQVIREKFTPDVRFLILKYSEVLRQEIKQVEELNEKMG